MFDYKYVYIFQGIEAIPLQEDSIFEWVAKVKGLKDTLWDGNILYFSRYC